MELTPIQISANELRVYARMNYLQCKANLDRARRYLNAMMFTGAVMSLVTAYGASVGWEKLLLTVLTGIPAVLVALERSLGLREQIVILGRTHSQWLELDREACDLYREVISGELVLKDDIRRLESKRDAIESAQASLPDDEKASAEFLIKAEIALGLLPPDAKMLPHVRKRERALYEATSPSNNTRTT
jgi:hypothetical protein